MSVETRFSWKEGGQTHHGFLSNFFIEPDGSTVEHEYQAAKTDDLNQKLWVLSASSPGGAKKRGRQVTLRDDWEARKLHEMRSFVLCKFLDHPQLCVMLLATEGKELVEDNWWGATYWGVCRGRGQNHLGQTLMAVRSIFRDALV